jgi:hypothetical protein
MWSIMWSINRLWRDWGGLPLYKMKIKKNEKFCMPPPAIFMRFRENCAENYAVKKWRKKWKKWLLKCCDVVYKTEIKKMWSIIWKLRKCGLFLCCEKMKKSWKKWLLKCCGENIIRKLKYILIKFQPLQIQDPNILIVLVVKQNPILPYIAIKK